MNQDRIRSELANLLKLPPSAITDELQVSKVHEWDSIACVSFVAFLIGELNYEIEIPALMTIQTVGDLWPLIQKGAM